MTIAVTVAFAGLMLTGWYAMQDPSGPSATPILVGMVLMIAPINLVRWRRPAGGDLR